MDEVNLEGDWLDMINEEGPASQYDCLLAGATSIAPAGLTRQHSLELSPPAKRKKASGGFESPPVAPSVIPLPPSASSSTSSAAKRQAAVSSANIKSDMSAEEAAEVVAAKATEELRANGLAFMEQESSTLHTLEEFRQAFRWGNRA